MNRLNKHPIKVVEQLTGLTAFVIRAWEKRYNAVNPERTETNRRLYSEEDVEKLKVLSRLRKTGYNIGSVAHLSFEELEKLTINETVNTKQPFIEVENKIESNNASLYIEQMISATKEVELLKLENLLLRASIEFTQPVLLENVIGPFVHQIGNLWKDGIIRVAAEHFASGVLIKFLSNLRDSYSVDHNASRIVITTPRGQHHEIGALLAAAAAAYEGWNVTYLSPNLPVTEIVSIVQKIDANALGLSIVFPTDDLILNNELKNLEQLLPDKTNLLLGGNASQEYKSSLTRLNSIAINSLSEFRNHLSSL